MLDVILDSLGAALLFFSVFLMNLPDIKFDYNKTNLQP